MLDGPVVDNFDAFRRFALQGLNQTRRTRWVVELQLSAAQQTRRWNAAVAGASSGVRRAERNTDGTNSRQRWHDLQLRDELDLVDQIATCRILHRHHELAFAQQQRQHFKALCGGQWEFAQGVDIGLEPIHVHHGVAHLAGERRLQLRLGHHLAAHQQGAKGNTPVLLLLLQRLRQLRRADEFHRHQRFANADDGHARLLRNSL